MRVWVVDSETTGTNPEKDAVVEVAGILLDDGVVVDRYESLVDPGRDVPPEASAVHHLTRQDLVGAPTLEKALEPMLAVDYNYLVAHNASFDSKFLGALGHLWICTWKLALRTFPDAPSYGNQVLRYHLGLEGPTSSTHAHRALYDAEVTAQLFLRMLDMARSDDPYERMLKVSEQPALLRRINFGKHSGLLWSEAPADYLTWILQKSSGWDESVLYTARYWAERRG